MELDLASQARPELILNDRISGLMDRIKTDPLLQGAIIPAAIGEILRCVLDPENADIEDDLDWVKDWKRWAADILGRPIDDESIDPEHVEAKRREIIEGFARMARFANRIEAVDAGGDGLPNEGSRAGSDTARYRGFPCLAKDGLLLASRRHWHF